MAYRDELAAAQARVQSLERALEEANAQKATRALEANVLRGSLEQANAELLRIGGRAVGAGPGLAPPVPRVNAWIVHLALALALVTAGTTAIAGYRSESAGVLAAHWLGFALGGFLGARWARLRSTGACVRFTTVGALLGLAATATFFSTIWRDL